MATINRMVQNQREEADLEDAEEKAGIVREIKDETKVMIASQHTGTCSDCTSIAVQCTDSGTKLDLYKHINL